VVCLSRKKFAWDVVLDEQDSQLELGRSSPKTIAQLYTKVTSESQVDAHQQAQRHCSKKVEAEYSQSKPLARSVKKLTARQLSHRPHDCQEYPLLPKTVSLSDILL
jgi:hypothetical protein